MHPGKERDLNMEYLISTITDVICEEGDGDWEKLTYVERTAPLAQAYGVGLELAEFCITDNMENSFEAVLPHVEACVAAVKRKTLHAPYNELFPMAIDPKVVAVARDRYDLAWEYCLRFGADKMIVHANYVRDLYFPGWFINRHVEFWKNFLADHPEDITICLENVMENDPRVLLGVLEGVGDPRLKMCLDSGHANLSGLAPIEWLKACATHISHYHIHNNDGPVDGDHRSVGDRHAALDKGSIDMLQFLKTAEELTPNATAAVESYDPESCVRWLRANGFI